MSIWSRIAEALSALAQGEPLSTVFDRLKGHVDNQPELSVGFTIAVIALGAKLAKADGQVTKDEVTAFRRVFTIDEAETANAARVYNLARQDVAGDRKSTRLNSSHITISYAVFCLKKKNNTTLASIGHTSNARHNRNERDPRRIHNRTR